MVMIQNSASASASGRGRILIFLALAVVLELAVIVGLVSGLVLVIAGLSPVQAVVTGGGGFVGIAGIGIAIVQTISRR